MLLFPTFVQQSVWVGEKEIVAYDSDRATIPRSINVFKDLKKKAKLPTLASNGTILLYEIDTDLGTALSSGATGYSMGSFVYGTSDSGIIRNGDYVTLSALQDFLLKGEDFPSFQSGSHEYIAEGQSAAISMPTTSVSNGTNLPNLAEIYYLYYDVCID
ncbi:hypothetical protein K469DRAFT_694882 [Zopfia rhizophila CBS 207.26]|uniref:Uncharacterized protein n=1 Tax=Zopfia rhizophila CBS 207.26 TaxID=1314779 RepID=A0A6A6DL54_9PEZI|nr:hypothetical protein K469DRAFT_694882 [Zopfia rhizophila CBS 207.26]